MFNFEYRFTQTYEDKFTKPFSRSINFAENNLKRLTTQTNFAVEKVNDLGKSFEKMSKKTKIDIRPNTRELEKLEKEKLQVRAEVSPETERGSNLNMLFASFSSSDAKEQALSFSESLYEATKYGLDKGTLGKAIARQVKELDGLVSMSEMGNAVVSALKVGIRGSEWELAHYGKEIQKFHELTGKSYEEAALLIYKLKDKFRLPTGEISKVIDEMAV